MRQAIHLLILAVVVFLALPVVQSCAEESGALLENISFDRESSSRETITFKLNGPYLPQIFAIQGESPKVVFDFYDTRHSSSVKGVMKSRGNLVSAIRVGMHTAPRLKTRVVLDLVPAGDYDFSQDFLEKDNSLIITIFHAGKKETKQQREQPVEKTKKSDFVPAKVTPSLEKVKKEEASIAPVEKKKIAPPVAAPPVAAPPVAAPPVAAPPLVSEKKPLLPAPSQLLIHSISYEQTPDKGEKIVFQLSGFHPPVIFGIEEGIPSIVCDFMDAVLGENVPEVIPSTGKFVKQIRVEKNVNPHKIRVVLELVPNRHYDLEQVFFKEENLYVLFVKSSDVTDTGNSEKP
ncbi:MAG: AMIN domain-containing protein [Desulfocapsaceae bacterium]|nr:AMIN domain-containing protein [Desulfocapsaceae bacterium]